MLINVYEILCRDQGLTSVTGGLRNSRDLSETKGHSHEKCSLLHDDYEKSDDLKVTKIFAGGICCPMEVPVIESCLLKLDGVEKVEVAVVTKTVTVHHVASLASPAAMVAALNESRMEASLTFPRQQVYHSRSWSPPWHVWLSAALLVVSLLYLLAGTTGIGWLEYLKYVSLGSVALTLPNIMIKAFGALRQGVFDIHFLITLAVSGAIAIGEYTEAGAVVVLFSIADFLEGRCTDQARDAISSVLSLRPDTAILADNGEEVEVSQVPVGSLVLVRAGEKCALDGLVMSGISAFDESMLTGESVPVLKTSGDSVKAGTMNSGNSMVVIKTTASADDTFVAGMAKLVEEATSRQSRSEAAVAKFAKFYTPIIIVICVLIAFVPWYDSSFDKKESVYLALEVLVIACPCALVLSTPVTIVSALARAAKSGVLIKDGVVLENLASVKVVSFDKTGTLTKGEFLISEINMSPEQTHWLQTDVLKLLGSLERGSNHPFAAAISGKAASSGIRCDLHVSSIQSIPGSGITGVVDGYAVKVGNAGFISIELDENQKKILDDLSREFEMSGQTTCFVSIDDIYVCSISAQDTIRFEAAESIDALKNLGITPVMLTGDNASIARAVGKYCGIGEERIHADLMPQDKLNLVSDYRNGIFEPDISSKRFCASYFDSMKTIAPCKCFRYSKANREGTYRVAHVGDGVNDAPALALADVGIAMGVAGSASALEAGDIALFTNDLKMIGSLYELALFSRRTILFNIVFSIMTKAVVLCLAFTNNFTLWAAVLVDVGTALFVTMMGLRLLRYDFGLGTDAQKFCVGEELASSCCPCDKSCSSKAVSCCSPKHACKSSCDQDDSSHETCSKKKHQHRKCCGHDDVEAAPLRHCHSHGHNEDSHHVQMCQC